MNTIWIQKIVTNPLFQVGHLVKMALNDGQDILLTHKITFFMGLMFIKSLRAALAGRYI